MDAKLLADILQELENELRQISGELQQSRGNIAYSRKLHAFDLLTEFDTAIEKRLIAVLNKHDPKTPVVGEETGGDNTLNTFWLIDPIDGTIHFIRNNPFFTGMVTLVRDRKPVASIIFNYTTGESFTAIKGQGAFVNGAPLSVSKRTPEEAVILPEINLRSTNLANLFRDIAIRFKIINTVCAGFEWAMVASGKAEARITVDPFGKMYDFAPGVILVQEAGGVVKNFNGDDYCVDDSDFIAANSPETHQALLEMVKHHAK